MIKPFLCILLIFSQLLGVSGNTEHLSCFSDRDVYSSGDKVLIRVYTPLMNTTKIVYSELTHFSGMHISGATLQVENHIAEGYIPIPDSVKTGTYLLRTFYQSDGSKDYTVRDILVINRFEDISLLDKLPMLPKIKSTPNRNVNDLIDIVVPNTVDRRKNVRVKVNVNPETQKEIASELSISVSKILDGFHSSEIFYTEKSGNDIIEENKGITITGKVINKLTNLPVNNANVYLSIPDSIPVLQYYTTKKDGIFYFLLRNFKGHIPIVLQASKEFENDNIKILLDQKFHNNKPSFDLNTFSLRDMEKDQLSNVVESLTAEKIFNTTLVQIVHDSVKHLENSFFYGIPTQIIDPDAYIELSDFSEISKELLTTVKFQNRKDELYIKSILDYSPKLETVPKVFVDGVPIEDLNVIKNMGTSQIDWIHTVSKYRYFGDIVLPGVVAIYTGNYKLEWLKESDRLIKLDYDAIQASNVNIENETKNNLPDFRQVLLWKSGIPLEESLNINFYTSDIKGTFAVKVYAKKLNGEIVTSEKIINVI